MNLLRWLFRRKTVEQIEESKRLLEMENTETLKYVKGVKAELKRLNGGKRGNAG